MYRSVYSRLIALLGLVYCSFRFEVELDLAPSVYLALPSPDFTVPELRLCNVSVSKQHTAYGQYRQAAQGYGHWQRERTSSEGGTGGQLQDLQIQEKTADRMGEFRELKHVIASRYAHQPSIRPAAPTLPAVLPAGAASKSRRLFRARY